MVTYVPVSSCVGLDVEGLSFDTQWTVLKRVSSHTP